MRKNTHLKLLLISEKAGLIIYIYIYDVVRVDQTRKSQYNINFVIVNCINIPFSGPLYFSTRISM